MDKLQFLVLIVRKGNNNIPVCRLFFSATDTVTQICDRENNDGPENVEAYQHEQDNTEHDIAVVGLPVLHADVM